MPRSKETIKRRERINREKVKEGKGKKRIWHPYLGWVERGELELVCERKD
jgi:hypothetical protein